MSTNGLSGDEQDELVNDIVSQLDSLDDEGLDSAFEKLDAESTVALGQAVREYADNAVGDPNWDSDE